MSLMTVFPNFAPWIWKLQIIEKAQKLNTDTFLDVGAFLKIDQHKIADRIVYDIRRTLIFILWENLVKITILQNPPLWIPEKKIQVPPWLKMFKILC